MDGTKNTQFLFIDQPSESLGLHDGLGMLAAMLIKKGCPVIILDLRNLNLKVDTTGFISKPAPIDYEHLKLDIEKFKPRAIGLSVKSTMLAQTKELIKFLKTEFPQIVIVAGGPHLSLDGRRFMEETLADIGVIGEGEYTVCEIYEYLQNKRSLDTIKGIIYRQNGQILETPRRDFITDLDSLPFPDYGNFSSVILNQGFIPSYPIITSRGCPYSCTFCCSPIVAGKRWRSRSPENVLDELKQAKEKYKIKRVNFMEDNFTLNIERAKEILKLMIKEKLDLVIDFLAGVRADTVDEELLRLIKKARVQCISIGIESADPEVRRLVKKGVKLEDSERAIKKAVKAGINTQSFFIIGLPGSTYEKDLYSVDYARRLGVSAYWTIANAYPGTEMWQWVKENGRILSDFTDSAMSFLGEGSLNFDTPTYPAEKRKEAFERALIATRDFNRLDYSRRGFKKYLKVSGLTFKYDKKAFFIYQIYTLFVILRTILLRIGLYHWVVKHISPNFIRKLLFWKK
jgi:anaerobic magnesium-protoporphyrin IX monomethyl ester cyclase